MDWGAFAGGLSSGIERGKENELKKKMTQSQLPPGYRDTFSGAPPIGDVPFTNELQIPFGPQQAPQPNILRRIMTMFGG